MSLVQEIQQGESKTLEFKETLPSHGQIAKTVVAFANTSGGKLILGVNDQREIVGLGDIDIFDIQDRITSIIVDRCAPTLLPDIYPANLAGKLVLIVEIFRGPLLPYYLKAEGKQNGTYLRIGASNRKVGLEQILELERQRRLVSFDEEVCYETDIQTLDLSPLKRRFAALGKPLGQDQLFNLKLLKTEQGKLFATQGLLLLLGLPEHAVIKCARFKGTDMTLFLDRKEYAGDLLSQLEAAEAFLMNHLHLRGEIKGLQRTDTLELPPNALREALTNALIHRDYSHAGRDIKVAVFDDRVKIVSPGGLPHGLTMADLQEGRSELRNKVIARVFKELGYIEQWGSGLQRIKAACVAQGLAEPLVQEQGDFVDTVFYRPTDHVESASDYDGLRRISDGLDMDEKALLDFIESHRKITTKDLKRLLDIGDTKAKELFKSLLEKKLIQRMGQGRSTYYVRVEA